MRKVLLATALITFLFCSATKNVGAQTTANCPAGAQPYPANPTKLCVCNSSGFAQPVTFDPNTTKNVPDDGGFGGKGLCVQLGGTLPAALPPAMKQQATDVNNSTPSLGQMTFFQVNQYTTAAFATALIGNPGITNPSLADSGAFGAATKAVAMLYTQQPASGQIFVADLLKTAGWTVAPPAYAQGLGFSALNPILDTWKTFRNLAYFFYVIIFLIIGFAVMFRQKIGAQTAVTVQQALPNIIISLLAVTFSYAIAGLLIDLMYLVMFAMITLFSPNLSDTALAKPQYGNGININIIQLGEMLLTGKTLPNVASTVGDLVQSSLGATNVVTGLPAALSSIAAVVIFAIAMVFALFGLFFELLKTYISIVASIVFAPLTLMVGALPGNNAFQSWLKSLFFNLAVFPALLMAIIFSFLLQKGAQTAGGFLPPYLGGSGDGNLISGLIGMGVLLILKDIVIQVKKMGGGGGIMEQLANSAGTALKQGWTGGQLVPGLAFTDTNQFGISGQNILAKGLVGTEASRKRANDKQLSFMPRGIVGTMWDAGKRANDNRVANRLAQSTTIPRAPHVTTVSDVKEDEAPGTRKPR